MSTSTVRLPLCEKKEEKLWNEIPQPKIANVLKEVVTAFYLLISCCNTSTITLQHSPVSCSPIDHGTTIICIS
jgi:hypothetical protein